MKLSEKCNYSHRVFIEQIQIHPPSFPRTNTNTATEFSSNEYKYSHRVFTERIQIQQHGFYRKNTNTATKFLSNEYKYISAGFFLSNERKKNIKKTFFSKRLHEFILHKNFFWKSASTFSCIFCLGLVRWCTCDCHLTFSCRFCLGLVRWCTCDRNSTFSCRFCLEAG